MRKYSRFIAIIENTTREIKMLPRRPDEFMNGERFSEGKVVNGQVKKKKNLKK